MFLMLICGLDISGETTQRPLKVDTLKAFPVSKTRSVPWQFG